MILDTNALSAFIEGDGAVGALVSAMTRVVIPVIVLGEFRYGIAQSRHRESYESWLSENLSDFDIVNITEATTLTYAAIRLQLKRSGRPIPANDVWIAALALQHRLPILSRDEHFDAVDKVRREAWYAQSGSDGTIVQRYDRASILSACRYVLFEQPTHDGLTHGSRCPACGHLAL